MIADMFHSAQNISPASIMAMVKTCYHLTFSETAKQTQSKFTFLWGADESARKSEKTVRQSYLYANYLIIPSYKHCGDQVCAPDGYVKKLMNIAKNMIRKIQATNHQPKRKANLAVKPA